jgi:hypothetical protein
MAAQSSCPDCTDRSVALASERTSDRRKLSLLEDNSGSHGHIGQVTTSHCQLDIHPKQVAS